MDLKKIFKHEERTLYGHLHDLQRRYGELRERFEAFVKHFPPDRVSRNYFPAEAQFFAEPDKPMLRVVFCGKEFRFRFEMIGDIGEVKCLLRRMPYEVEPDFEELGRFTFNVAGLTNIVPPGGSQDPLTIDAGRAAFAIVASLLIAGIELRA